MKVTKKWLTFKNAVLQVVVIFNRAFIVVICFKMPVIMDCMIEGLGTLNFTISVLLYKQRREVRVEEHLSWSTSWMQPMQV